MTGEDAPDQAGVVGEGGDAQVPPPPAQLLAEHHVHQLGVVVVHLESGRGAVGLVVDVVGVKFALTVHDGGGGDVDNPGTAGAGQLLLEQVGEKKMG